LTFIKILLFKKERFKRGEKRKGKNIFSGDFDVFASSRRPHGGVSPHVNSLIVVKKQREKRTPARPEKLSLCSDCNPSDFHCLRSEPIYPP